MATHIRFFVVEFCDFSREQAPSIAGNKFYPMNVFPILIFFSLFLSPFFYLAPIKFDVFITFLRRWDVHSAHTPAGSTRVTQDKRRI